MTIHSERCEHGVVYEGNCPKCYEGPQSIGEEIALEQCEAAVRRAEVAELALSRVRQLIEGMELQAQMHQANKERKGIAVWQEAWSAGAGSELRSYARLLREAIDHPDNPEAKKLLGGGE